MPFLELASIHRAGSHLSNAMGLSSKIVPSFTENCRPQSRHFQMRRVLRKPGSLASHAGQVTPLGQRSAARKVRLVSLSAKYRTASCRVEGSDLVLGMQKSYSRGPGVSSMLLPYQALEADGRWSGESSQPGWASRIASRQLTRSPGRSPSMREGAV